MSVWVLLLQRPAMVLLSSGTDRLSSVPRRWLTGEPLPDVLLHKRPITTTKMHLRFYHTIFEAQTKQVPAELWEAILSRLNIVFAVYGHKLYNNDDPHQLHCIIEEDGTMKNFKKMPIRWQKRAKFIREVKNVGPYAFHMKLVLLDEPDLRIMDNT